jgi:hypothetical protein
MHADIDTDSNSCEESAYCSSSFASTGLGQGPTGRTVAGRRCAAFHSVFSPQHQSISAGCVLFLALSEGVLRCAGL